MIELNEARQSELKEPNTNETNQQSKKSKKRKLKDKSASAEMPQKASDSSIDKPKRVRREGPGARRKRLRLEEAAKKAIDSSSNN